jgi:hypothetical protein
VEAAEPRRIGKVIATRPRQPIAERDELATADAD